MLVMLACVSYLGATLQQDLRINLTGNVTTICKTIRCISIGESPEGVQIYLDGSDACNDDVFNMWWLVPIVEEKDWLET